MSVTEEEVQLFLERHFDTMSVCDAERLEKQFVPEARLTFIGSDGREDRYTVPQYMQHIRRQCEVYRRYQWDRSGTQIAAGAGQATVRWNASWSGGKSLGSPERAKLKILGRLELKRVSGTLMIDELTERFKELETGAEQEFWTDAGRAGLFGAALKFYRGTIEMAQDRWRMYRKQQHLPGTE